MILKHQEYLRYGAGFDECELAPSYAQDESADVPDGIAYARDPLSGTQDGPADAQDGVTCATVVCGHDMGAYAMIGAGAVITKPVLPYALVVGNPATLNTYFKLD